MEMTGAQEYKLISNNGIIEIPASQKNINQIKNELKFNNYPNPTNIIIIVCVFVLVMYYIYIFFLKTDFSGVL